MQSLAEFKINTDRIPLASGRVAELYEWGDGLVIKLWRKGGQQDAEREARIARSAYAAGVATPKVIEMVEVDGRGGIVFERAGGPSMTAVLTAQPWNLLKFVRQFAELQADLNRCDAPPELESAHHKFENGIRRAGVLTEEQRSAAIALLHSLPKGDRLCHGDLHPDNILMSQHGPMIVDWPNAVAGPPVADVARTAYLVRHSALPSFMPAFQRLLITVFRAAFYHLYLQRYSSLHPIDRRHLAAWAVPIAAARISEGIQEENGTCIAIVKKGILRGSVSKPPTAS